MEYVLHRKSNCKKIKIRVVKGVVQVSAPFYVSKREIDDFPGPVCTDEDQLVKALEFKDYDYDKLSYFQIKYMVYTDGKNTSRVIDTINQIMEEV